MPALAMDASNVGEESLPDKRTLRQIDQVRRLALSLARQRRTGRHPPGVTAHRLDHLHRIGRADGFGVKPRFPDRYRQPSPHPGLPGAGTSLDQVVVDWFG